jgi:hypothetical protein
VTNTLKQCETLVHLDLNKRYSNELYLYLEESHIQEKVNLFDLWNKIAFQNCFDKDNSIIMNELEQINHGESIMTDRSGYNLLDDLDI